MVKSWLNTNDFLTKTEVLQYKHIFFLFRRVDVARGIPFRWSRKNLTFPNRLLHVGLVDFQWTDGLIVWNIPIMDNCSSYQKVKLNRSTQSMKFY